MVSPQFSYCPSGNDNHCVRKPQLRALVCMVSPQFSYCPSGNDNHCVRKPQLRVLVCMVSPQFSYCPSGNDNHDVETTTPGLGMYGITTVQLLSVRKRPPRHGNHNSGPWYVWYHHSSVTVRPVTTTTAWWKPQLRALVCMVSPQFSYCPSGNDNHWREETTTPGLGMYGITTVQLLSVR